MSGPAIALICIACFVVGFFMAMKIADALDKDATQTGYMIVKKKLYRLTEVQP